MSDDFDYQSVSRPSTPIKCLKCEELRAALAEAERETDEAKADLETCECALAFDNREFELIRRRAEQDLATAREVMTRALAWADDFDINDTWTDDTRAFLLQHGRPIE